MQVVETKTEGLHREFTVTVPVDDIEDRIQTRLNDLAKTVRIDGFRPGKVPPKLLRQRFGEALFGEVVQAAVEEGSQRALVEQGVRPAAQPQVELTAAEQGKDLEFTLALDVMPEFETTDLGKLEVERMVPEIEESRVDEAIERLAKDFRQSEAVETPRPAKEGDIVVMDFVGKLNGEAFEGGTAENHQLELGSGQFIPGFEEQLVGIQPGESKDIEVTFPEEYGAEHLAGQKVTFEVVAKELREPQEPKIDDEFAKSLGLDDLAALREQLRSRLQQEYAGVSKARQKRVILDRLDETHSFELPPQMVEQEFSAIMSQFEQARSEGRLSEDEAARGEEDLAAEFRPIAERRVRLGLVLAEIGRNANIEVTPEEVNRAMIQQAQNFPGQEAQVIEFYRQNEQALASLRAPLYEDKVIDYILEMAKVTDRPVSIDELMRDPEETEEEAKAEAKPKAKTKSSKTASDASASTASKPKSGGAKSKKKSEAKKDDSSEAASD